MNVEYNVVQTNKDKTTKMMISPAHFDEVVKHSPLRVLKSYDLCEQVMCRRARCQERSFQLEDLIRGKCGPLLFLWHPVIDKINTCYLYIHCTSTVRPYSTITGTAYESPTIQGRYGHRGTQK